MRGAHLDATRGFFNGPSVFLCREAASSARCIVDIVPPTARRTRAGGWPPRCRATARAPLGFGRYRAADYDELIDHPVEIGDVRARLVRRPAACRTRSRSPAAIAPISTALARDLKRVCAMADRLFGRAGARSIATCSWSTAVGDGYGGLEHRVEHRASSAAATTCRRRRDEDSTDGYRTFLGLASHEYFHTWNVKRIKPAAFIPYDLDRENYTRLLWAFEGFTSYYDDLALVRCGVDRRRAAISSSSAAR